MPVPPVFPFRRTGRVIYSSRGLYGGAVAILVLVALIGTWSSCTRRRTPLQLSCWRGVFGRAVGHGGLVHLLRTPRTTVGARVRACDGSPFQRKPLMRRSTNPFYLAIEARESYLFEHLGSLVPSTDRRREVRDLYGTSCPITLSVDSIFCRFESVLERGKACVAVSFAQP